MFATFSQIALATAIAAAAFLTAHAGVVEAVAIGGIVLLVVGFSDAIVNVDRVLWRLLTDDR